ncbi:M23 family metallopeptidase [uncultured Corynebacterium sp.]|uniref:M23 family metallopeptidase n=1 Tax=uncultured Corynebacterium sp. TaxID=159447 RepID=UPI0025F8099C|nr:M23 family metallopeptidase [uncultured Corynebacterium sp.]
MKRSQLVAAGLLAATVATLAPHASAETHVASVDITNGSSTAAPAGAIDAQGLVTALTGLAQAADGILNGGVTPTIDHKSGQVNIVLDPSTLPGFSEALSSSSVGTLSTSMRGQTASGAEVVFPTSGRYTSGFGMRWGAQHNGIDVANSVGTPIVAVMDGTVINSGPAQGFGNWIRIKHDDGSVSVYGHMRASDLLVSVGDRVTAGQQISSIGNEGQSTGPHLHFEIHPDGTTPVDPQQWFAEQGISF